MNLILNISQWKIILQALSLLLDKTDDSLEYLRIKQVERKIKDRMEECNK